ncbi:MAG: OmpA family protein [Adhaeribacter sp.]
MRNFYLLALACLMAFSASGQKMKTAVADKYYQDFQFLAAAQAYERIIRTDTRNVAVMEKLVHCYTRLNDPVKSQFWLSKVLKSPQPPVKSFKTFGTLLAANGRYEEASQWFGKSYEQTRDEESLRWLNTYRNLQQFYADSALYQISKVHFNSKYADFSPVFYQDGVVFSSARDNGKLNKMKFEYNDTWFIDLYYVKDTLAKPVPFSEVLNSKYHEGPLSFTPDQQTVYFTRNNHLKKSFFSSDGVSKLKIYYASVYNGRWGQIREFNLNNKEYSVGQPALASDKLMYFVSDMPGGYGGTDLYRTEKVNGVWQKPVNLGPGINTSGNEMFPFVGEGDMLYFASNGHPGLGGLDVFYTAVSGTDFSPVGNLGYPVNTARDDFGFIIRNNQGYFSSNRDSKTTNDDIYRFKVSQQHPVMVVAREKPDTPAPDSLSGAQGKTASLALEAAKENGPLAANSSGDTQKDGLPATPGEENARLQEPVLPGAIARQAMPDSAGLSTSLPTLSGQMADPEEANRNTFALKEEGASPETAAADPWKGADPFFPAIPRQDSASRQSLASVEAQPSTITTPGDEDAASSGMVPAGSAARDGLFPMAAGEQSPSSSLEKQGLARAGDPAGVKQADSASDLPAHTGNRDGTENELGQDLANPEHKGALSGIGSGEKAADASKDLAWQDPKQEGSDKQNQGDRGREIGPAGFLAETGSQPSGEAGAAPGSGGDRTGDALFQPGAIKRVKTLAKEFKTGAVGEVIELEILYDLDKTTIRPDAAHVLNGLVAYMKKNPQVKVELGAHTDVRGSDNYNERLSQGRAESVVDYLARHGISRSRLVAVGFGEKDLALAAAATEAEHQVNRRTTAKIFANEALLMAYHESVTQPKLAAIRARQQQEQASRLASDFPLLPDHPAAKKESLASGQQVDNLAAEGSAGTGQHAEQGERMGSTANKETDAFLAAATGSKGQPRSTSLQAAAEDGISFEAEAPAAAPAAAASREMLFWNPNATDPKVAAAQAKKNPDTFFIISNAFLSLVEAEWYLQEVLDLGGEGRIIMPFAGSKLYRVAVAGYNKYSEAERQLPAKKQVFGTHSWILGLNSREFALRRMVPESAAPQTLAAAVSTPPGAPAAAAKPAAAEESRRLLASANTLIATLERRIEGLESRLAAAEAGALRTVKAAAHAPKVLYDKVLEANRHRASARLWAEVAPHTINQKTGRAYVVSGSFSTLGSANWYRKKMARMGGSSKIILPNASSRLYVVTVADYAGRNEARQKLLALKKTFGLYIWILDY